MSADRARGWPVRRLLIMLLVTVLVAGAAWALLPRKLEPVKIERAELLPPGTGDGSREPVPLATPVRIAITFATSENLAARRAQLGLDYIAARLSGCRGGAAETREVITQDASYLSDYGRVRRLAPGPDGHARYRAVFDNRLTEIVDHQAHDSPALTAPGGLCFRLFGARMWFGTARSAAVPVRPS